MRRAAAQLLVIRGMDARRRQLGDGDGCVRADGAQSAGDAVRRGGGASNSGRPGMRAPPNSRYASPGSSRSSAKSSIAGWRRGGGFVCQPVGAGLVTHRGGAVDALPIPSGEPCGGTGNAVVGCRPHHSSGTQVQLASAHAFGSRSSGICYPRRGVTDAQHLDAQQLCSAALGGEPDQPRQG